MSKTFAGKKALITGATGGIGRELVRRFVDEGAEVVAAGRSEEALAELGRIDGVEPLRLDLADDEQTAAAAARFESAESAADILVNGAGVHSRAELPHLAIDELERVMKVNFTNTVRFTQGVYAGMRRQGRGKIVNISSLSGKRGYAGGTSYTASKFALLAFTQCLAMEAVRFNIQVNAVCPGFVETEMAEAAMQAKAAISGETVEKVREASVRAIPAGRWARPSDVASVVLFLCSPNCDYIVGQAWNVDGGQHFGLNGGGWRPQPALLRARCPLFARHSLRRARAIKEGKKEIATCQ